MKVYKLIREIKLKSAYHTQYYRVWKLDIATFYKTGIDYRFDKFLVNYCTANSQVYWEEAYETIAQVNSRLKDVQGYQPVTQKGG